MGLPYITVWFCWSYGSRVISCVLCQEFLKMSGEIEGQVLYLLWKLANSTSGTLDQIRWVGYQAWDMAASGKQSVVSYQQSAIVACSLA